jgi:transposase
MPRKRLSVRKIREVLRLKGECGLSNRQIARSCGISRPTVADYLQAAELAGLGWPLPEGLDDAGLERRLFPPRPVATEEARPEPSWPQVHRELRRKGVTLTLLWQEYKAADPDGFQYTWFCEHYRRWAGRIDLVMRQEHRAGEKLFVDYAGQTAEVVDRRTGEIREAQLFVAVLGASSYTYAEVTWTQGLPDWIGSHVRAFEFFGGCSEILVPDNLASGVTRPHLYEPDLNPTYQDMAAHFGVAVIPARVAKPKDKAKAEAGVQLAERWILARLRNLTFFSLSELNAAVAELLVELNGRPFQKIPGSRRELFEQLDKPALKPLPQTPYEYAEWSKARVHIDYHVAVDTRYYSVPYQLVGQQVEIRLSARIVEVLHKGKRVASHPRCYDRRRYITLPEHMPKAHREHAQWTPQRIVRWAEKTGPATARVVESILIHRPHPQQGFRSCLGLLRLGKKYSEHRLEAACRRALAIGACSYKSVESILKNGLDRQPLPQAATTIEPLEHSNIRGADYYH